MFPATSLGKNNVQRKILKSCNITHGDESGESLAVKRCHNGRYERDKSLAIKSCYSGDDKDDENEEDDDDDDDEDEDNDDYTNYESDKSLAIKRCYNGGDECDKSLARTATCSFYRHCDKKAHSKKLKQHYRC